MTMKIFILTQEEPFYLPRLFLGLFEKSREIVGVGIGKRHNTSFHKMALKHFHFFGPKDFIVHSALFSIYKFSDWLSSGPDRCHSIKKAAKLFDIPALQVPDVNDRGFIRLLKNRFNPDLVVSVSFSQVLRKDFLNVPSLGCINLHSGLLPKYRGMLPTFWAMANNEKQTGVTVHFINEKIDQGEIILQYMVPIEGHDTLNTLIKKNKEAGLAALLDAIERIRSQRLRTSENDPGKGSYYSFPTREDSARFKAMGWKVR